MRPCKVKVERSVKSPINTYETMLVEEEALFHALGSESKVANDAGHLIGVTVAIVELADGQMTKVFPHHVRFTDKGGKQ
jgi:hypothetical protein